MEEPAVTETPTNGSVPPPEAPKEPPKEEPKVPEPPKELVSDKFAALARKEKGIVRGRQELSAEKSQFERDKAQFAKQQEEFTRWQKLKENAKIDPDSYLNEAGLSYGYLTERALKGDATPGKEFLSQTQAQIDALRKELAERDQRTQEDQKTQAQKDYESRWVNFVQSINTFVDENKTSYELITLHEQQSLIPAVIQEAARRKTPMTVKQAADKVEEYLTQQVEKAVTTTTRFKDKFEAKKAPEPPKEPGPPTLNNSMNTTTPISPGYLSDQERMARALAVLNKFD